MWWRYQYRTLLLKKPKAFLINKKKSGISLPASFSGQFLKKNIMPNEFSKRKLYYSNLRETDKNPLGYKLALEFCDTKSITFSQNIHVTGAKLALFICVQSQKLQQGIIWIETSMINFPATVAGSELTIETLEQGFVLVSLLLTLKIFHTLFQCFHC